jgi:oleate hydratase
MTGHQTDDVPNSHRARDPNKTQAYLIGGGIASLSAAVTLMHEAKVHPTNIHIIESSDIPGGSMDAAGSPDTGYIMRGGRMLNFSYLCLYDLLRQIPSLTDNKKSVLQEIEAFNEVVWNKTHDRARLVRHHVHSDGRESAQFDDGRKFGMSGGDRLKLVKVMMQPEHSLGKKTIRDCFDESFFQSNFWFMWCSMLVFFSWV